MRYSLASHSVKIVSNKPEFITLFDKIQIGGEGNAIGAINVAYDNAMWNTKGYATGAWVHEKNLSRVGKVTISINQLSPTVTKFITCINYFYGDAPKNELDNNSIEGLTLTVMQGINQIALCEDCYITQIPSQDFGESSADQSWVFTSGCITFGTT